MTWENYGEAPLNSGLGSKSVKKRRRRVWEEQALVSVGCKGGTCGGWRDLRKGVGMKRGNGDILGNHQATAAASMNNVPPSICWV